MIYTTQQRNDTIELIAKGETEVKDILLYEALESFNWIKLNKSDKGVDSASLTYAGNDINSRLKKISKKQLDK